MNASASQTQLVLSPKAAPVSRAVFWLLPLYSMLGMTAMSPMNLSFLALLLCLLVTFLAGCAARPAGLAAIDDYRAYRFWAWLLFATCTVSLLAAHFWPVDYAGTIPDVTLHGILKIWYMIVPSVIAHAAFRTTRDDAAVVPLLERTVRAWGWMTLFLGVIAVIQFNTGWPLEQVIPTNPTHYHAILFFGHHLSTASIIPFPTSAALAVALGIYTRTGRVARFELAVGCVGLLILFLSYARTAWLTFPIGVALLLARYLTRRQFLTWFGSFAAAGVALCFTPAMKERIQNQMGIQDRFRLWEANLDFFTRRPLTGIGWLKTQEMSGPYFKSIDPEHYTQYFWGHAHSNFFEMLGGTGLIGLLAWLGWSWFTLRLAYRNSRIAQSQGQGWIGDLSWGIFVGLILLHLNGLTNVTFWEGKVMHEQMFCVGLLLVFSRLLRNQPP